MRVVALGSDLLIGSRLESMAVAAGATFTRCAHPDALPSPADVDLLLVDWGARGTDWAAGLAAWRAGAVTPAPPMVLFGPHTDLAAHAAARSSGLGPMRARSAILSDLPNLLARLRP